MSDPMELTKHPIGQAFNRWARGVMDMRQGPATGNAPGLSAVNSAPSDSTSKHTLRSATVTDAARSQLQRTNTTDLHNLPGDPLAAWRSLARRTSLRRAFSLGFQAGILGWRGRA